MTIPLKSTSIYITTQTNLSCRETSASQTATACFTKEISQAYFGGIK